MYQRECCSTEREAYFRLRQSRTYAKIHVTWQFLKLGPVVTFLKNKKKTIFRYGLGKYVYHISGLYRFSFGQGARRDKNEYTDTQIYKSK